MAGDLTPVTIVRTAWYTDRAAVVFLVRWVNARGEKGPWSETLTVTIRVKLIASPTSKGHGPPGAHENPVARARGSDWGRLITSVALIGRGALVPWVFRVDGRVLRVRSRRRGPGRPS